MNIAILGTRGIPNNYGGFEQFAEYLSVGMVERGHDVTVYSPHFHDYKKDCYKGVKIRHIFSPEKQIGAMANFIYDFLCLKDALKYNFDIIYEAGYHSNAPSYFLMGNRKKPILITNMDGLEWKRSKWNWATQKLILRLERLAVAKSHYLISDNVGIQTYYKDKFNVDTFFIPYGADKIEAINPNELKGMGVNPFSYYLLIARIEPENNIEIVLDGYLQKQRNYPFIVIGNCNNKYGKFLQKKYSGKSILFAGSIYDKKKLDQLRFHAKGYFHGHSVGGTNPSLLEAMGSGAMIIAHNNIFNQSVLGEDAFYFESSQDINSIFDRIDCLTSSERDRMINSNFEKINTSYNWDNIIDRHIELFNQLLDQSF